MGYADRQALENAYGVDEIAQRESVLPAGSVASALASADATIDGYLVGLYVLPLTTVPANLPQIACALARYTLLGEATTERARNDYKDAIAWLRDVQAGRVKLQAAAPTSGNDSASVVMVAGGDAVFKRSGRP